MSKGNVNISVNLLVVLGIGVYYLDKHIDNSRFLTRRSEETRPTLKYVGESSIACFLVIEDLQTRQIDSNLHAVRELLEFDG
jgi:hypothetical protein